MASFDERMAALIWAAGFRGVTEQDEALDWMEQRGLIERHPGGPRFTESGAARADSLYESLLEIPASRRARTNRVALGLAIVLIVWRWRR